MLKTGEMFKKFHCFNISPVLSIFSKKVLKPGEMLKSDQIFLIVRQASVEKESPGFNIFNILAFPQFQAFFRKKVLKIGEMLKSD